jgi:hypothetical protein
MPGVGASASATAQAEPTVEVTPESEPAPEGTEAEQTDSTALLQAVSAGANRQQGENDLEAACQFVADWVAIKASCGLAVDQAERDAIELTLESCGERPVVIVPREPAAGS